MPPLQATEFHFQMAVQPWGKGGWVSTVSTFTENARFDQWRGCAPPGKQWAGDHITNTAVRLGWGSGACNRGWGFTCVLICLVVAVHAYAAAVVHHSTLGQRAVRKTPPPPWTIQPPAWQDPAASSVKAPEMTALAPFSDHRRGGSSTTIIALSPPCPTGLPLNATCGAAATSAPTAAAEKPAPQSHSSSVLPQSPRGGWHALGSALT